MAATQSAPRTKTPKRSPARRARATTPRRQPSTPRQHPSTPRRYPSTPRPRHDPARAVQLCCRVVRAQMLKAVHTWCHHARSRRVCSLLEDMNRRQGGNPGCGTCWRRQALARGFSGWLEFHEGLRGDVSALRSKYLFVLAQQRSGDAVNCAHCSPHALTPMAHAAACTSIYAIHSTFSTF